MSELMNKKWLGFFLYLETIYFHSHWLSISSLPLFTKISNKELNSQRENGISLVSPVKLWSSLQC